MLMTKYIDRFANRKNKIRIKMYGKPGHGKWSVSRTPFLPPTIVPTIGHACRGCGKAAQVELTTEDSDAVEYLCYEDLGPFLELFTHPGIREWTIVRLP